MPVPVDEIVYVLVPLQILLGVAHQKLPVLAHVGCLLAIGALETAMLGPGESESHAPAGMDEVEETLARAVMEHAAQEPVFGVGVTQPVAVGEVKHLVVDFGSERCLVDDEPALFFQIAVGPDVVVAGKEVYLHAHVCQFGELAEEPCIAFWHHVAVLVPEVEHVAQQIDGGRLGLDAVEKPHQSPLLGAPVRNGPRAEVCVGEEIYVLHRLLISQIPVLPVPLRSSCSGPIRGRRPD